MSISCINRTIQALLSTLSTTLIWHSGFGKEEEMRWTNGERRGCPKYLIGHARRGKETETARALASQPLLPANIDMVRPRFSTGTRSAGACATEEEQQKPLYLFSNTSLSRKASWQFMHTKKCSDFLVCLCAMNQLGSWWCNREAVVRCCDGCY